MLRQTGVGVHMLDATAAVGDRRGHLVDDVGGGSRRTTVDRTCVPVEAQPTASVAHPPGTLLVVVYEEAVDRFLVHGEQAPLQAGSTQAAGTDAVEHLGDEAAAYFGVQPGDPRVPDVFGIAQVGVVYTGHKSKIAEHGGANPQDRDVPLVVWRSGIDHQVSGRTVETTQIAPTILKLLGLDPQFLQAVQIEHTPVLPLR